MSLTELMSINLVKQAIELIKTNRLNSLKTINLSDRKFIYRAYREQRLDVWHIGLVAIQLDSRLRDESDSLNRIHLKQSIIEHCLKSGLLEVIVTCPEHDYQTDRQTRFERTEIRLKGHQAGAIPASKEY